MTEINTGVAFAAGFLSFLSPCVLPLIPGYISFISGISLEDLAQEKRGSEATWHAAFCSLAFVGGFSLIFILLGASATAVGRMLEQHLSFFTKLAGIVIVVFGLHLMGALKIPWLYYERRFDSSRVGAGVGGAFIMGLAFAFGWTPCVGPILAGILALAATESSVIRGMSLLFVYSMGVGIPFVLTALGTQAFMRFFARYKRFVRVGEMAAGALLVVVGLLLLFNRLTLIASWAPAWLTRFAW